MEALDLLHGKMSDVDSRDGSRVLLIASGTHTRGLTFSAEASPLPGLDIVALDNDLPVPDNLLASAGLLIIEVDPGSRVSLQRIKQIRKSWPSLLIVAAIRDATVSLVRTLVQEGVSDVVALPFDANEVMQTSLDAVAKREASKTVTATSAPLISVVRSQGGCGTTSIATHLAARLAEQDQTGKGVIIVDLDLQFGSVADLLGINRRGSFVDLLGAKGRLDDELVHSVTAEFGNGLFVIGAPDAILPLEAVNTDQLLAVIHLLRRRFAYVVLDLPADWTNWALSAVLASDVILLVVELTLPSLRQAKRRLELFRSVGIEESTVEIVVNRFEKRLFGTIDLADVSKTLSHPVLASIALEQPLLSTAQNQSRLVGSIKRNSKFAADIARLSDLLLDGKLGRTT